MSASSRISGGGEGLLPTALQLRSSVCPASSYVWGFILCFSHSTDLLQLLLGLIIWSVDFYAWYLRKGEVQDRR